MKTSELIKILQEEDPNDECTVCINNHPVSSVERAPYYYDGRLEYIERDKHYQPIKVGYKAGGQKIKIHYDTLEDALMDNPEAELVLDGITYQGSVSERHMLSIREWQKDGREFQEWKRLNDEAYKNGTEPPPIVITSDGLSLQARMSRWLRSIGLLK